MGSGLNRPHDRPRSSRRSGTKALVCPKCPLGPKGQVVMSFRGRSAKRLALHLAEAHARKVPS